MSAAPVSADPVPALDVRPARSADEPAAVALWTALHRHHEALDARYRLADDAARRWATDFRTWTRARADGDRVFVADAGPEGLVGLATAHLMVPTPAYAHTLFAWVDDLVVADGWQGRGAGRGLLGAVRAWALAAGATELRAGVLARNPAARRFWAGEGGADFSVTVTLPLG